MSIPSALEDLRATLAQLAPDALPTFDAERSAVLQQAREQVDTAPMRRLVGQWAVYAALERHPERAARLRHLEARASTTESLAEARTIAAEIGRILDMACAEARSSGPGTRVGMAGEEASQRNWSAVALAEVGVSWRDPYRYRTLLVGRADTKEQWIVSAQHAETPGPGALPLRTIGDIRAALRSGHGFPGDRESFEADLQRALEASSETDLNAVATVIVDYRGRIRLYQDPDFDVAVQEGIDLTVLLKREAPGR